MSKAQNHNPLGTDGFEFVEFTAPSAAGIAQLHQLLPQRGLSIERLTLSRLRDPIGVEEEAVAGLEPETGHRDGRHVHHQQRDDERCD